MEEKKSMKKKVLPKIGNALKNFFRNVIKLIKKIRINRKVLYGVCGILVLFFLIKIFSPKDID